MILDRDAQRVLEMAQAVARKPMDQVPIAEAREGFRQSRMRLSPDPPEVADVRDLTCPGKGGPIKLRLYRGAGTQAGAKLPAVLYFHGGGWAVGDLETHDVTCRQIANAAHCAVLAVDYRLAPENKFPAAVEDAEAALNWLAAQAGSLGVDPDRLAVCGDSSGGNLAAVVSIAARERGGPRLRAQILVYPVTDLSLEQASYDACGDTYTLSRDAMRWFRDGYVRDERDRRDWRAAPLHAPHLRDLPPALVFTAGCDPLCDEGTAYAKRLAAEGVVVEHKHYPGQMHGFLGSGRYITAADRAIGEIATALRAAWR